MMSRFGQCAVYVALAGTLFVPAARAQYTNNFQTNTISGANSNWSGNGTYVVGSNTFLDALIIQSGGVLSNDTGYLGYLSSGSNNVAVVTDAGSTWSNRLELYVGRSGSGNQLIVSNGGAVIHHSISPAVYVGFSPLGSNNAAVVTGTGSVWRIGGDLSIGYGGDGNQLVVSNGGRVVGRNVNVGRSGNTNVAVVTGPGSVLTNTQALSIGGGTPGAGNALVVNNGGAVICGGGGLGGFPSSSNNTALVTGTGSVLRSSSDFLVGGNGAGSQLVVSNGGVVFVDGTGQIGNGPSSSNNVVMVTGAGSAWTNTHDLLVGAYGGSGNSLVISNQGAVFNNNGYVGLVTNASFNSVCVVDGGIWQSLVVHVGEDGSSNSAVVGGGSILTTSLVVGATSATCDNLVQLNSGYITVTNAATNAVLEVQGGKLILNGGVLQVDRLVMTNSCGLFVRNGGTLIVGSLLLDPNMDADGDGMANGWEQTYGLDPLNAADASADNDGDGMSNLQEYMAGTDPTNSASVFRILSVVPTNNDMLVTWATGGGRTNIVQAVTDLTDNYTNVSPNIVVLGSGDVITNYLDAGAATNAASWFYRIRLVP